MILLSTVDGVEISVVNGLTNAILKTFLWLKLVVYRNPFLLIHLH
jgi:hypothetical protein